ncbi:hypothetical protein BDK51DRAFT_46787 [Blyttiomyces helicus]|uniref:Uncharacterized protein n=1 Tax=Blyttiomyces helicus TaxID=388810 RepID=A0A4P9WJ11_9FUNG|nr:hypothetical protein BDK51DRAFT_46787 [Blyttiomyces helicus]|eukprot:RKO90576.1 hypothetical protein BDK51DRAFT_46787 [Blyttiomyces helicus]
MSTNSQLRAPRSLPSQDTRAATVSEARVPPGPAVPERVSAGCKKDGSLSSKQSPASSSAQPLFVGDLPAPERRRGCRGGVKARKRQAGALARAWREGAKAARQDKNPYFRRPASHSSSAPSTFGRSDAALASSSTPSRVAGELPTPDHRRQTHRGTRGGVRTLQRQARARADASDASTNAAGPQQSEHTVHRSANARSTVLKFEEGSLPPLPHPPATPNLVAGDPPAPANRRRRGNRGGGKVRALAHASGAPHGSTHASRPQQNTPAVRSASNTLHHSYPDARREVVAPAVRVGVLAVSSVAQPPPWRDPTLNAQPPTGSTHAARPQQNTAAVRSESNAPSTLHHSYPDARREVVAPPVRVGVRAFSSAPVRPPPWRDLTLNVQPPATRDPIVGEPGRVQKRGCRGGRGRPSKRRQASAAGEASASGGRASRLEQIHRTLEDLRHAILPSDRASTFYRLYREALQRSAETEEAEDVGVQMEESKDEEEFEDLEEFEDVDVNVEGDYEVVVKMEECEGAELKAEVAEDVVIKAEQAEDVEDAAASDALHAVVERTRAGTGLDPDTLIKTEPNDAGSYLAVPSNAYAAPARMEADARGRDSILAREFDAIDRGFWGVGGFGQVEGTHPYYEFDTMRT